MRTENCLSIPPSLMIDDPFDAGAYGKSTSRVLRSGNTMRAASMLKKALIVAVVVLVGFARFTSRAADTLPAQYTDAEFWKMINDFSEPGGAFPYENFVSNEVSYMDVLPDATRISKPGRAYLGVAP